MQKTWIEVPEPLRPGERVQVGEHLPLKVSAAVMNEDTAEISSALLIHVYTTRVIRTVDGEVWWLSPEDISDYELIKALMA